MRKQVSFYRRLAIIIIGISLMAPMLYSVHFYAERMLHRMHMWKQAEHKKLETFVVDSASIQWAKKNRELILNGEYFDIVSIHYQNGKATIKGVFDHKETEMHKAFTATNEKNNGNDHATRQLANWLLTGWLWNKSDWMPCEFNLKNSTKKGWIDSPLPIAFLSIPLPPPWQLG